VLRPDTFEIRTSDGSALLVPYEVARYAKVEGPKKAAIYTQGGLIWVEAQGDVMPAELDRQLSCASRLLQSWLSSCRGAEANRLLC